MARYKRDDAGFDMLAVSPEVKRFASDVGDTYKAVLESYAPVGGKHDPHRGLYRSSLTVDTTIVELPYGPRWAAEIAARVRYAAALEYGSTHVPDPPRPLTKLLDIVDAADPNTARKAARKRRG